MTLTGMMANCIAVFAITIIAVGLVVVSAATPPLKGSPGLATHLHSLEPEEQQAHRYTPAAPRAPHTATGGGLHAATTGVPASFTVHLVGAGGGSGQPAWTQDNDLFIYVWIASPDQILIAEVVNSGNGTLTATYESSFAGDYLVYIEEVRQERRDEGRPIAGSPFSLTITGAPTLIVDELPVCVSANEDEEDIEKSFWRPGTWLSSILASAAHGVTRNGWVFQPKSCVHDTFTYDDMMLLASLEEETWLLVAGDSVYRGVFLTLVDMMLAKGQKDDLERSVVEKCWGYADIRVGNLRVTYQDFRLFNMHGVEDTVVCNNEKLSSGSTTEFIRSCKQFLSSTVFKNGAAWPSVVFAPSNIGDPGPNHAVEVILEALPETWTGKLMMADHMAGFGGYHWKPQNPTRAALRDVGMVYHRGVPLGDAGLQEMRRYRGSDPRVSFMSVFPLMQAKLFENQDTRNGVRKYAASVHYHYVSESATSAETQDGARMVQSTITEMLANLVINKAVGSKTALREKVDATPEILARSMNVRKSFEVCSDCPPTFLPIHVKPIPDPTCTTLNSLPGGNVKGEVWNTNDMCPSWCMAQEPVSQSPTESGPVDVRECRVVLAPPPT